MKPGQKSLCLGKILYLLKHCQNIFQFPWFWQIIQTQFLCAICIRLTFMLIHITQESWWLYLVPKNETCPHYSLKLGTYFRFITFPLAKHVIESGKLTDVHHKWRVGDTPRKISSNHFRIFQVKHNMLLVFRLKRLPLNFYGTIMIVYIL